MFCRKCGKVIVQGAKYCVYCGCLCEMDLEPNDDHMGKGTILKDTYEILEEIGSGGGGVVFKARHLRLQTDVVVKKIKDEVRGKIRSRQEADILKKLKHPYLPRVYDFIETEDGVYTVMDFIHGINLDDAVKRNGGYSQNYVRKWAQQLGEALDYLHSQNPPIIHSDIKPANIMLTEEGNICLIDFNISLAMGSAMESAVGISAGFSPPEQYRDPALYAKITHNFTLQKSLQAMSKNMNRAVSDNDDKTAILPSEESDDKTAILDHNGAETSQCVSLKSPTNPLPKYTQFFGKGINTRSDIYSLGVTLYFLLTDVEPSLDFEQRIPIRETGVPVSEGFALILNKMMEIEPEKRYRDGREYLKAIRNCYKLDHRYVVMHRKQIGIQFAALACLMSGILFLTGGFYKLRLEENSTYYNLTRQAQEAMNQYDLENASELIKEAKEISETRIDAYGEEVYLLYLNGDYEGCIKLGEEYINTTPFILKSEEDKEQYGNIYYIVGNSYFEINDYPNARNLFEHALEYNSRNGLYYRDYAITLAKLGQIDEAVEALKQAIKLGIAQDSVYMAEGEIAYVKGQYENALEYFNQTLTTTVDMQMKKRAVLLCTDIYKAMGNEAVDDEIALLELYMNQLDLGGSRVLMEYLADAYARKAGSDEAYAQEYYKKSLDLFQSLYDSGYITWQLQLNMAVLYENMDYFAEAQTILFELAEKYPERYEVYMRLAYLEADKQQMKENADRDYTLMQEYYEQAVAGYSEEFQDMEMDMLGVMMQELRDGGWF